MEFYDPELVLETEHLILRKLERTDAMAIYHMINHDRDVLKYYVAPYMADESEASVEGTVTYCEKAGVYHFFTNGIGRYNVKMATIFIFI